MLVYIVHGDEAALAAFRARATSFGRFRSLQEKRLAINEHKLFIERPDPVAHPRAFQHFVQRYSNVTEMNVADLWPRLTRN